MIPYPSPPLGRGVGYGVYLMWYIVYLLISLCGFITTLFLTKIFRNLAIRWRFIDQPSERKFHRKPTPLMGGVAIFLGFWITIFAGLIIVWLFPSAASGYAQGVWMRIPWLISIFIGGLVISGVGLWDDKSALRPKHKLLFQFMVAIFTVLVGIRARLFLPQPFSYIISIIWILAITNAFNLLDNMDGVSSGIAFIGSFLLFLVAVMMKNYFISSMLSCFMGTLLGFLCFNFPPADIFMGDCGSMFIGYIISVVTILGTYFRPESPTIFPVFIPLLVLAVPLFDTLSVIFIRIAHKKPIFQPDKNHFSHRLVNMGMKIKTAVLFLYLVTFCVGLPSVLLPQLSLSGVLIVFSQAVGIMVVIAILEYYGENNR